MNTRPLLPPAARCVLSAGLALSPCALAGKTYQFHSRAKDAKWYFVLDPESTATVTVLDSFGLALGSSCDFRGVPDAKADRAKRILVLKPKQHLQLKFRPGDDKAQAGTAHFRLFDETWNHGGRRYSLDCRSGKDAVDGEITWKDDDGLDHLASNPNAVEIQEEGMASITIHMPAWDSWKTLSTRLDKRRAAADQDSTILSIEDLQGLGEFTLEDLPTPKATPSGLGTAFDWPEPATPKRPSSEEKEKSTT